MACIQVGVIRAMLAQRSLRLVCEQQLLLEHSVSDPFIASLVEQELCSMVESFAPSARSTWSQTVVLDRSARGRRNAKPLDVGPAPVKTRRLPSH